MIITPKTVSEIKRFSKDNKRRFVSALSSEAKDVLLPIVFITMADNNQPWKINESFFLINGYDIPNNLTKGLTDLIASGILTLHKAKDIYTIDTRVFPMC